MLLLPSLEVSCNLDAKLDSGEYREWFLFSLFPVTPDKGRFATPVSVHFMGTRTWDDNGCLRNHKAFLTPEKRGVPRGDGRPLDEAVCLVEQQDHWPESKEVAFVPRLPAGRVPDHLQPQIPVWCTIKTPAPPCILSGPWWGDKCDDDVETGPLQMEVIIKQGV